MTAWTASTAETGSLEPLGWVWQERADRRSVLPAHDTKVSSLSVPPTRATRVAKGLSGLGLLCAVGLAGGFLAFVQTVARSERPPAARADGIVALTGGAQRIGDAIDLLAAGHGRRLLITGVNERTSREEIARLNPNQSHWIACCVDLDYRARNTIGNAIETRRWMRRNGFGTVAVVTSNYHMPRTLVEIDHALADREAAIPYPVVSDGFDVDRWWADPASARLLGAEYLKFLAAWVRTRFEGDPEHSHFALLRGKPVGPPVTLVAAPRLDTAGR